MRSGERLRVSASLGFDDLVADGVVDEFGEGVEVELEHDVGAMSFGGVDGDAEQGGDFFVGFAFGEELQDFAFAGSEAGTCGLCGGLGRGFVGKGAGHPRREVWLVLSKGVNGGEEHAVSIIL